MKNFEKALQAEQQLRKEENYNVRSLALAIKEFGYETAKEYLEQRKIYSFQTWKPEVVRPVIDNIGEYCVRAVEDKQSKIVIPQENGLRVWEGAEKVDRELCKELNIKVENVGAGGGTIVGSEKDFSTLIIIPIEVNLTQVEILDKFVEILSKYTSNVEWVGNDILLNGKKVGGTTYRVLEDIIVFTCQISFKDYSEFIEMLCTKKSTKVPSYIDNSLLTRDQLEEEVLNWLVNKQ